MMTAKEWDKVFDAVDFYYYCPPVDVDQYPNDPSDDPNQEVILIDDDGDVIGFDLPDTDIQPEEDYAPLEDVGLFEWICNNEDRLQGDE